MDLSKGALIAVVDGEKLSLFRNIADNGLTLSPANAPQIDAAASGSPGRRSSAANPDNDTQAEDGFAAGVAEALNTVALNGSADQILVIAAPRTLGELRKHWHKELKNRLVGEIAKDLAGQSPERIAEAINAN